MDTMTYNLVALVLIIGVLGGIKLMSSPKTAVSGNLLGALAMLGAIIITLVSYNIIGEVIIYVSLAIGAVIGYYLAIKVAMLQMPQLVALLNGFGGGASALVALVTFLNYSDVNIFSNFTGSLALIVGGITFSGSLIAAGKLDQKLPQKPIILNGHTTISVLILIIMVVLTILNTVTENYSVSIPLFTLTLVVALIFGVIFSIRVGGADMPVTISLLNSLSGLAGSFAGFVVNDPLLVAIGGIVGAAGLILTQIMCKAMNRSLIHILTGKTTAASTKKGVKETNEEAVVQSQAQQKVKAPGQLLQEAKKVIIVPGYGMALAQAQHLVKELADKLEGFGKEVKFAIHPVAGRMPGHMNVLLAEAGVDYERLYEMEDINPEFKETDLVIVVGANDVVNPAANTAEGTPIYGMPILRVDEAKQTIICNYDTKPGYAGVDNPLYEKDNVKLLLGDAKDTVEQCISLII
jgi:NAD(P) transhydrogenase subunit beta